MMTKDQIVHLLETNDKAIARALVVLNDRQTADEQRSQDTKYHNGRGFRPCHAHMGTSMAQFFLRNGFLTPKQIQYWRKTMADGNMRIGIYWKQLAEEAEAKAAAKSSKPATVTPNPAPASKTESFTVAEVHLDEIEMQRMEAEADRIQTIQEETAKWKARNAMESIANAWNKKTK